MPKPNQKLTQKQIKQLDKQIVKQLTQVCHIAQNEIDGFVWLTHTVDYANLDKSLKVIFVFATTEQQASAEGEYANKMKAWVVEYLQPLEIKLYNADKQIQFDSEQACDAQHNGNWQHRLACTQ
ncbi:Fis family transcriptional regulator [Catenovulum sp. SX2]|uniref:Fis family transcriptional regulator n=1 Tax=Catenovulum sp. SX2 TaxID=3398614 RepID=UPI003F85EA06